MGELSIGLGVPPRPPIDLLRRTVEHARAVGASTLWVIDHFTSFVPHSVWDPEFSRAAEHSPSPDRIFELLTTMGYLAAVAPDLRVASGVTDPIRRHPLMLAQAVLTLSHMTDHGVVLGIGAGEAENLTPYGFDFDRPVSRLEEALRIIRTGLSSRGPFDFEGEFHRLDGAILDLEPGPGGLPEVWVAAHGPRMLRIAGEHADGWYPSIPMDGHAYAGRLAAIEESARSAGRPLANFTPAAQMFVIVGESDDHARSLLDLDPVRLMALLLPPAEWERLGAIHPLGRGEGGMVDFVPQRHDRATMRAALDAVPGPVLERCVTWGGPDTILRRVRELHEAGLHHAVLIPVPGSPIVAPEDPRSVYSLTAALTRR